MTPTVVVTGAAGFIGVPTVGRLLDAGANVVAVDSGVTGAIGRLRAHPRLCVIQGDVRDPGTLEALSPQRPTVLVHLAAMHFIPWCDANPAETLSVNIVGFQHVLDWASSADVARVVFASTADVYLPGDSPHAEDDPTSMGGVYSTSKLVGEHLAQRWSRSTGRQVLIPRLFNVYGPGETNPHVIPEIIDRMRASDRLPLGNVEPRRDYVFVEDVASALMTLALRPIAGNQVANIGTGVSWSVAEVVELLRGLSRRPLEIVQDESRMRRSDRLNLQASVLRRASLLPEIRMRALPEGLGALLATEGLLPPETPSRG